MIIVTELGDKTFFIAAILAMQYSRMPVFTGAATALVIMTFLSVAIGFALPSLLPKAYTHYAATALVRLQVATLLECHVGAVYVFWPEIVEGRIRNGGRVRGSLFSRRHMTLWGSVSDELEEVEQELGATQSENRYAYVLA